LFTPIRTNNPLEIQFFMKRLALLAAVVLFVACAPKAEETPADTAAPAATDSTATMTDSTMMDSTAAKAM
jgi:predicted outer membrane protein